MESAKTAPKTAAQRNAEMRERKRNAASVLQGIELDAKRLHEAVWSNFTGSDPVAGEILGLDAAATLARLVDKYAKGEIFLVFGLPPQTANKPKAVSSVRNDTRKKTASQGAAKVAEPEK